MNSTYAYAVANLVSDLQHDITLIGSDVKYLHTMVYPEIAAAMWKGYMRCNVVASRLTDGIHKCLTDQGFVVRETTSSSTMEISWGLQTVYPAGQTPKLVSSKDFIAFIDGNDAEVLARHEGRHGEYAE